MNDADDLQYLQTQWRDLMRSYEVDEAEVTPLFDDLVMHYTGPDRHYHNLHHVRHVLGVIDELRSVKGVELAMTVREPPIPDGLLRRVSMRSASDSLDVSAIARLRNGGGHKRAAGFSSDETIEEIIEFVRSEFADAAARA